MTIIKSEKSGSVRKVRLKTASGFLNLCYRSSQMSSQETNHNSSERCSVKTVSQEGSQASVVTNELSFGSLPELFDFEAQFPINECPEFEGHNSLLVDLQPDFSTYNFWASESRSESGLSLSNAVKDLSDTFSRCHHGEIPLHHPPEVLDSTTDEVKGPDHKIQISATKSDLQQSQNSINISCVEEETTNRNPCWDLPILELKEELFECNWNLLKELTEDEIDIEGEMSIVDNFLVDRSPPQPSNVDSNVENLDIDNLLVYAPNRYLDKDASYIFQSSPADVDIEKTDSRLRMIEDERIPASYKVSSCRKKGIVVGDKNCSIGGEPSTDVNRRNSHTASWMEVCPKEVLDVPTTKRTTSKSETGENVHTRRMQNFNHRRRRFSAPGLKRLKFLKHSPTKNSLDSQRSPNPANREKLTEACTQSPRGRSTPTRKVDTPIRRVLQPGYFSDSPPSGDESDHDCHKTPRRMTPPRQFSMPSDDEKTRVRRRADISLLESNLASSSLKVTPNQSFIGGGAPNMLSLNLLRKKRTRYTDVCHNGPDSTSKIETKHDISSEYHAHPKNSQIFTVTTTPRGSPAIAQLRRSPWDGNRKKVRTFRRRASHSSPTSSAKRLQFYCKSIVRGGGSGHDLQQGTPSPDLDDFSAGTKLADKRGRRRLPLPQGSVEILRGWLHENLPDPYPSREEKEELQFQTGLKLSQYRSLGFDYVVLTIGETPLQVDNWLGNARQKLRLKSRAVKDLSESSSSPELKKRSKRKRSYPLKMKM